MGNIPACGVPPTPGCVPTATNGMFQAKTRTIIRVLAPAKRPAPVKRVGMQFLMLGSQFLPGGASKSSASIGLAPIGWESLCRK